MPGLFGIASHVPYPRIGSSLAQLSRPIGRWRSEQIVDLAERWAVGRTHLGVLQPGDQLSDGMPLPVLFHGDVANAAEVASSLDGSLLPDGSSAADLTAALYTRFGTGFPERLHGSFSVAIVDRAAQRVVLASDLIGSYPLYWTIHRGALIFAHEVRSVERLVGGDRTPNPATVSDYLTFGFPLGSKTLVEGIELLPPGSTLEYRLDTGRVQISPYASVVDLFEPWRGTHADYMETLRDTFTGAVERALSGPHRFGLALSGGLDSRAILSAVNGHGGSLATCTLGSRGCSDEVIAEKLATLSGTRHTFFELGEDYLGEFLPNIRAMVALTDGMYLSHGLTEMLAVGFLANAGIDVLLRGHGGELAKTRLAWPLHTDARIDGFTTTDQLVPYLLGRANYISADIDLRDLFTDAWFDRVRGASEASLRQSLQGVSLSPPDLCSYLYLTEHHRRFTVASLELFRQAVEVRLPFVDRSFLEVLFRGDAHWRDDTSIHKAVIAAGRPEFLRVRDSNTGASPGSGPVAERVLDKVNSLFRRLNIPGYRHYHSFQRWVQQQLLASVEATLLDPRTIGRGIFRESFLRRLIQETRLGRQEHGYLLQVLLILELWQRGSE